MNTLLHVVYDFGNYKNIHNELLKDGQTDLEEWFDKECLLDDEIDSIYDIVKNEISQILASRAAYLGLTSKRRDVAGSKAIKSEIHKNL